MIELKDVVKTYSDRGTRALKGISLKIEDGEFVFIMGRSGAGKSTLLRLLMKETEPSSGSMIVNGMDLGRMKRRHIPKYRRTIGVVFQDFRLLPNLNVYENVAFAQRVIGKSVREIRENVPAVLQMVGLSSKYKHMPSQLAGGEQQRVAIARAIVNRPQLLLADEPTGNLDAKTAGDIMALLERINENGTTVVVITHSREIVERMKKRVIYLKKGRVSGEAPVDGGYEPYPVLPETEEDTGDLFESPNGEYGAEDEYASEDEYAAEEEYASEDYTAEEEYASEDEYGPGDEYAPEDADGPEEDPDSEEEYGVPFGADGADYGDADDDGADDDADDDDADDDADEPEEDASGDEEAVPGPEPDAAGENETV